MASTSCCSRGAAGLGPALRLAPQTNLNLMITHYNYFRDMSKWFYVLIADRKFGVQFLRIPYTHKDNSPIFGGSLYIIKINTLDIFVFYTVALTDLERKKSGGFYFNL